MNAHRFWICVFEPSSKIPQMSTHVLDTIAIRPFPKDFEFAVMNAFVPTHYCHRSLIYQIMTVSFLLNCSPCSGTPFGKIPTVGFDCNQLQPHILFEMATPSSTFMTLWTRTLVGFPDVRGAWMNHQLEESIKSVGENVTMYHDELLGRQVVDTYAILLAVQHIAPKIKVLKLEQTRYSYTGFKASLPALLPVVKDLVQTAKDRPDNIYPVVQLLISAEERKITQNEICWLKRNTKADTDLRRRMKKLQIGDHLALSWDIFCSWCMQKCTRAQVCSHCSLLRCCLSTRCMAGIS